MTCLTRSWATQRDRLWVTTSGSSLRSNSWVLFPSCRINRVRTREKFLNLTWKHFLIKSAENWRDTSTTASNNSRTKSSSRMQPMEQVGLPITKHLFNSNRWKGTNNSKWKWWDTKDLNNLKTNKQLPPTTINSLVQAMACPPLSNSYSSTKSSTRCN